MKQLALTLAILAAIGGFILSTFSPSWMSYVVYPIGTPILIFLVMGLVLRLKKSSKPTVPATQSSDPAGMGQ